MSKLVINDRDESRQYRGPNAYNIRGYMGVPSGYDFDDDRAEKPWQRVLPKFSKSGDHLHEPTRSVPSTLLIVVLGVYLLLGYLTQLVEDDMPRVVQEASLPRDNSDRFSEEVAWWYMDQILGDAPRVAGTKYHLEKSHDMKRLVDEIAAQATINVTTDWQMVSGHYFLNTSSPFFNVYQNCSNIMALLEGESGYHSSGSLASSILVNCHYDSVPFAIGAADNGIFCAAMAETLAKLSKRTKKLRHNVIFLFNGAEENTLQGSHGFLHHPWSKGVTSVINLDSAGMNGKPIVFQVTDPRLMRSYSRTAYRPAAQGLAEFLFLSGIIPSDTDFRIFRDFADIQGIDIAFTKMGHVYHTRNDRPELIRRGVLQNAGDMLLGLVADIADQEDMDHKIAPSAAVYYDYLNAFMLTYSFTISYVVDALIGLFGLASVSYYLWLVGARWSSVRELLFSCLGRVVAMLAGVAVSGLFLVLMRATTTQMRYLSRAWLVVPLYWLPYLLAAVATSQIFDAWRWKKSGLSRSLRALQALAATRLILSAITLVLVCIPGLTTLRYLFSLTLFIQAATSLISITTVRYVRLTGWQHLILEVLLSLPSVMWAMSTALRLDAMMLPIMGRSAGNSPDYIVGILNIGLVILVASTASGIELLFSRRHLWAVLGVVAVPCVVLMFVPFSPYDADGVALQRHYWFHTQITNYGLDGVRTAQTTGVLVSKLDPYSLDSVAPAIASSGAHLSARTGFVDECKTLVYCGLPLYRTSFASNYQNAMFLYTGGPAPYEAPVSFTVASKACAGNSCTFEFVMTGGAHNMVTFWPYPGVTLSRWSLQPGATPTRSFTQLDRPVYVVYHSTPTYTPQWSYRFELVFDVPPALQAGPIVDVAHHSHKLYHPESFTDEYKRILASMPKYFNVASTITFRNNYVF